MLTTGDSVNVGSALKNSFIRSFERVEVKNVRTWLDSQHLERQNAPADTAVGDGNLNIVVLHGLALEVNDLEVGPGRSPWNST